MKYLVTLLIVLLAACAQTSDKQTETASFVAVSFSDLPGWNIDHLSDAVPAIKNSCAVRQKAETSTICANIEKMAPGDAAARLFVEQNFQPYKVTSSKGGDGLFTGYYVPQLHGSRVKGGVYQTPLYALPDDLITVDLGDFKKDLQGQKIVGKVDGRKLQPYDARYHIMQGSLNNRASVLVWVDDPVDAFFLAVQGSGNILLSDGGVMNVGYAGANGQAYVAIGKAMADQGLIERPVTMEKIRNWLKNNPAQRDTILNSNPSYVFFKKNEASGAVGAQGSVLTPQRSLAVDPRFIPLGSLLWLDTTDGTSGSFQRLVVAQDTGGAIKGAVRGDVFWGAGDAAAAQAGAMQSAGQYFILKPKNEAR
jgi:membrane-bound lytic murein transglycosylase A